MHCKEKHLSMNWIDFKFQISEIVNKYIFPACSYSNIGHCYYNYNSSQRTYFIALTKEMDHIFISVVAVGSPMRSASPFNLKFA